MTQSFMKQQIEQWGQNTPEQVLEAFRAHYPKKSSLKTMLSKFRRSIDAPEDYKSKLKLTKGEYTKLNKEQAEKKTKKLEKPVFVVREELDGFLDGLKSSKYAEVTKLLVLTGRRFSAVMKTMEVMESKQPGHIRVRGIIKKRGDLSWYEIPCIESHEVINSLLACVRRKFDCRELTLDDVNAKYSSLYNRWFKKRFWAYETEKLEKKYALTCHSLRPLYAELTRERFDKHADSVIWYKKVLCHGSTATSHGYHYIRLVERCIEKPLKWYDSCMELFPHCKIGDVCIQKEGRAALVKSMEEADLYEYELYVEITEETYAHARREYTKGRSRVDGVRWHPRRDPMIEKFPDHKYLFSQTTGAGHSKSFACFKTVEEAFKLLSGAKHRVSTAPLESSKLVKGSHCRYFIDIDHVSTESLELMHQRVSTFIADVNKVLGLVGLMKPPTWSAECFSRQKTPEKYKHSYHLYSDVVFDDVDTLKAFASKVFPRFKTQTGLKHDINIYKTGNAFRLPGTSKDKVDIKEQQATRFPSSVEEFEKMLWITFDRPEITMEMLAPFIEEKTREVKKVKKGEKTGKDEKTDMPRSEEQEAAIAKITSLLRLAGDDTTEVGLDGHGRYVGRGRNRVCLVSREVHSTCGCHFNFDANGGVWYRCFDVASCPESYYLGGAAEGRRKSKEGKRECIQPRKNTWPSGVTITRTRRRWVQDITKDFKCTVIRGFCGQGKTTAMGRLMTTLPKGARVMTITSRRTQAHAMTGKNHEGFAHYQMDCNANKEYGQDKVICQYESLYRFLEQDAYDVVVLDEVRSIIDQFCSTTTNKGRIGLNASVLRSMCRAASKVVVMDADVECDDAVMALITSMFKPKDIELIIHTKNPHFRYFSVTDDSFTFIRRIEDMLEKGETVAIACQSKRTCMRYEKMFQGRFKTLAIHGDSDPAVKRGTKDIDGMLKGVSLFLFTSALTVCADCQLEWDNFAVDAYNGFGCSARNIVQMLMRFRRLKNKKVLMYSKTEPTKKVNINFKQIRAEQTKRMERRYAEADTLGGLLRFDHDYNEDRHFRWTPSWITRVYIENRITAQIPFGDAFRAHAEYHKFRVCSEKPLQLSEPDKESMMEMMKGSKEELDSEISKRRTDALEDASVDPITAIEDIRPLVEKDEATQHEVTVLKMAHLIKHWDCKLTLKDVDHIEKNLSRIMNIASLMRLDMNSHARRALSKVARSTTVAIDLEMTLQRHIYMNKCMKLLGINGIFDKEASVHPDTFNKHAKEIISLCARSVAAGGKNARRYNENRHKMYLARDAFTSEMSELYGVKSSFERKVEDVKADGRVYKDIDAPEKDEAPQGKRRVRIYSYEVDQEIMARVHESKVFEHVEEDYSGRQKLRPFENDKKNCPAFDRRAEHRLVNSRLGLRIKDVQDFQKTLQRYAEMQPRLLEEYRNRTKDEKSD